MCDVNSFFCRYPFDQYLRVRLLIGRSLLSLLSTLAATSAPISTRSTTESSFPSPTCSTTRVLAKPPGNMTTKKRPSSSPPSSISARARRSWIPTAGATIGASSSPTASSRTTISTGTSAPPIPSPSPFSRGDTTLSRSPKLPRSAFRRLRRSFCWMRTRIAGNSGIPLFWT